MLIDMGEALRASVAGFERRKRLPDICVYLPSSKDLVVLAALDDKLVHVVVGISQEITNMDDLLNPANIIVLAVIAAGLFLDSGVLSHRRMANAVAAMGRAERRSRGSRSRTPMCLTISIAMSCLLAV